METRRDGRIGFFVRRLQTRVDLILSMFSKKIETAINMRQFLLIRENRLIRFWLLIAAAQSSTDKIPLREE